MFPHYLQKRECSIYNHQWKSGTKNTCYKNLHRNLQHNFSIALEEREQFYCIPWLTQVPCLIATIQLLEDHWHQAIQHRQYYIVVYKAIDQSGSHRVHEVEHSPPRGYSTKTQVKYIWKLLKTSKKGWNPIRDNNMRCLFTYYTALFFTWITEWIYHQASHGYTFISCTGSMIWKLMISHIRWNLR